MEKILVDGKEFFEGDVSLAVKNLPSDIIASIEILTRKVTSLSSPDLTMAKKLKL